MVTVFINNLKKSVNHGDLQPAGEYIAIGSVAVLATEAPPIAVSHEPQC